MRIEKAVLQLSMVLLLFLPWSDSANAQEKESLYLELVVNGRNSGKIAEVIRYDDSWILQREDLIAIGLRAASFSDTMVTVDNTGKIRCTYDQANQRLLLTLPISFFSLQEISRSQRQHAKAVPQRDAGLLVNYSLYATDGEKSRGQQSLWHGLNYFNSRITLSTDGLYRKGSGWNSTDNYLRLNSRLQYDDPEHLWTLQAGDVISGAPTWGRNMRTGGIRLSRDYSMNPDIISFPVPDFSGRAALPGSVELLINEQQRFKSTVNPGPFVIESPAWLTGAGTASVITTDIQGRQVREDINFYIVSDLLKTGLSDFDITLGWLREDFGLRSDQYSSRPVVSGLYRYGLTHYLTPEVHWQSGHGLNMGGIGLTTAISSFGAVEASFAQSHFQQAEGHQYSLGYRYHNHRFGVNVRHLERSENFRDAGALEKYQIPRAESQVGISLTGAAGTFSTSYFQLQQADLQRTEFFNISWSKSFYDGISAIFSLGRRLDRSQGNAFSFSVNFPFGRAAQASLTSRRDQQGKTRNHLQAMQQAPYVGGWGWNLAADDQSYMHAFVDHRGEKFIANMGLWGDNNYRAWSTELSGSLVYMNRQWFAAREIYDAFALIDADGIADIPVYIGYQPVGKTNRAGYFLLSDLTGYTSNRIAIDPLHLSATTRIAMTEQEITPARRGGVVVRFPIERQYTVIARVTDQQGHLLAPGTFLRDTSTLEEIIVGWDGDIYLESPVKRIWRLINEDNTCLFTLAMDTNEALLFAGDVPCEVNTERTSAP